jgi:hypothetical protein
MDSSQLQSLNSIATTIASIVALIISIIALVYTAKTFLIVQGIFCKFAGQVHPLKEKNTLLRTLKTDIRSADKPLFTDLVQDS